MNFATPEFLQQNIHMVSYDHQGFDSKNNYVPANPNSRGFQELKLSDLTFLSFNMS